MEKINVMDVMEQEKLTEAMEYIKAFVKSAKAMLEEQAEVDDSMYWTLAEMEKVEKEINHSNLADMCENPAAWLE